MKRSLLIFFQILFVAVKAQNIIPRPSGFNEKPGEPFVLNAQTIIRISADSLTPEKEMFLSLLKERYSLIPASAKGKGPEIILTTVAPSSPEVHGSYRLTIAPRQIHITSSTRAGIFYGLQTLMQLGEKKENGWNFRCAEITDEPRFLWRGMHLDVCRHFFSVEFIRKYIDLLASYKMNVFHWHLTEDQGWRIEIKKYPLLTQIGSVRKGSMVGHYNDHKVDSVPYGGFYTQDQIREVVNYAAQRHVTVVPEIEMPGHSLAALSAYPALSCTGGPFEPAKIWGVFDDVYCTREETFKFLEGVLDEVCSLFPGKYIHIGGDECPKTRWKTCAQCQKRIREEGLRDEHELQSYFIRRIEKYLNGKGKQIIGWDEILEGGLAPNAAVMSWRGEQGGIAAARQKHRVVMSPGSHCYFDHYQGLPELEPVAIGGFTPLEKVYSYEPVPDSLNAEEKKFVMGAQANVWTEYINRPEDVEYMVFPRMLALSEVLWTPASLKNTGDFFRRLDTHLSFLEARGVNYSRSHFQVRYRTEPALQGVNLVPERSPVNGEPVLMGSNNPSLVLKGSGPFQVKESGIFVLRLSGVNNAPATRFKLEISRASSCKVTFIQPPSKYYNTDQDFTLVNGIRGTRPRQNKQWLGWSGNDAVFVVDLREVTEVRKVTLGYLEEKENWIWLPKQVKILVSDDGNNFREVKTIGQEQILKSKTETVAVLVGTKARYVKFEVMNTGKVPAGSKGEGNDAWLFLDEIMID